MPSLAFTTYTFLSILEEMYLKMYITTRTYPNYNFISFHEQMLFMCVCLASYPLSVPILILPLPYWVGKTGVCTLQEELYGLDAHPECRAVVWPIASYESNFTLLKRIRPSPLDLEWSVFIRFVDCIGTRFVHGHYEWNHILFQFIIRAVFPIWQNFF